MPSTAEIMHDGNFNPLTSIIVVDYGIISSTQFVQGVKNHRTPVEFCDDRIFLNLTYPEAPNHFDTDKENLTVMDLNDILDTIKISDQHGHILTVEEGIVLHSSLLILQNENHFRRIFFWGKIFGIEKDYYITYGYRKDALLERTYYYSTNLTTWGLLPKPTDYGKMLTPLCSLKFQGDPALMLDVLLEKDEIALGGCPLPEPQVKKLKEEDRLAATIFSINEEAAVVPRGALFKRPDGVHVANLSFEGLSALEAREIKSFLHYRKPQLKWNTNLLTREDYNYAMDFLDPLDIDIPERCWTITLTAGETLVTLKPLFWPGMLFYHFLGTPKHGFLYFGNGIKCMDVPFLISSMLAPVEDLFAF